MNRETTMNNRHILERKIANNGPMNPAQVRAMWAKRNNHVAPPPAKAVMPDPRIGIAPDGTRHFVQPVTLPTLPPPGQRTVLPIRLPLPPVQAKPTDPHILPIKLPPLPKDNPPVRHILPVKLKPVEKQTGHQLLRMFNRAAAAMRFLETQGALP